MPTPILMPALSPTMEQGKLAKWLKKEGDKVSSGDAVAEIETDKATMEVEAVDEGTIGKIMIPEGTEGVAVNTPIAMLLSEGEDAAALKGYGAEPAQPGPKDAAQPQAKTPSPRPSPQGVRERKEEPFSQGERERDLRPSRQAETLPSSQREADERFVAQAGREQQRPFSPRGEGRDEGGLAPGISNGHARIFASPLARRLAGQAGIASRHDQRQRTARADREA